MQRHHLLQGAGLTGLHALGGLHVASAQIAQAAPDGTLPRDVMPDLLHLNKKGHATWAAAMAPTLERLMTTQP